MPDHSEELDAVQTAMLLTEQEWQDLAFICSSFLVRTHGTPSEDVRRRRRLAYRVCDAAADELTGSPVEVTR